MGTAVLATTAAVAHRESSELFGKIESTFTSEETLELGHKVRKDG